MLPCRFIVLHLRWWCQDVGEDIWSCLIQREQFGTKTMQRRSCSFFGVGSNREVPSLNCSPSARVPCHCQLRITYISAFSIENRIDTTLIENLSDLIPVMASYEKWHSCYHGSRYYDVYLIRNTSLRKSTLLAKRQCLSTKRRPCFW